MRLLLHQFRKDFRQTWIIWALWLFFVIVQFGLAAWRVNPGDLLGSGIYAQIIGMVPAIHAILLFVLIPLLVFQESPVGTTASWLSRPMPPLTILGSKLISFGILVLVPLLGQCAVLAAHHVLWQDVVFAGVEIALKELSWIALATGLAALCPNFGAFLVAAAGLYVLQYFSGWIWNWLSLLHIGSPSTDFTPANPFLGTSRFIASNLTCIIFGFSVAVLQYLTRRTRAAIILGLVGLMASAAILQYWPWDFVNLLAGRPDPAPTRMVPAPSRILPGESGGISEQNDPRGLVTSRSLSMQFLAPGLVPEENMSLKSEGGEQVFPDGSRLTLKPGASSLNPGLDPMMFNRFGYDGGINLASVAAAIGDLPILNQQFNTNAAFYVRDLFTLDSKTFAKQGTDLGTAVFHLKGSLGGYRIAAEIPLVRGAFFSDGSKRTTLTEILKTDDGVNVVLRQRSLNLLLAPANPANAGPQPIYLLVNRKKGEALGMEGGFDRYDGFYYPGQQPNALMSAFNGLDNHFEVITPVTLPFHSQQIPVRPLAVPIDDAWVADATLVQLEPVPHGDFTASVSIPDFALDGHTLAGSYNSRSEGPDLEALKKIVLPPNPTRADVWRYITRILYASSRQRNRDDDNPQVEMLAQVGAGHATDLLIAITVFSDSNYPYQALKTLDLSHQEDAKKMIFRLLPIRNDLVELIVLNHWEVEAKPILLARLTNRQPQDNIDEKWLDALALFHDDPLVKQAILDLLPYQQDTIRIVIANHWENEAKPILISAIARTKPGSRIDDRWVQVLESFHDDSRVKAMLLRVLPSNQNAIETVVENHWETDAKPILLETLNNAKPGASIDERWFSVLASLSDQSGVKEAVLRVLPFCHNAIETVVRSRWEEACPVILDILTKAREGETFDDRWFQALYPFSGQNGVKETILELLPRFHNAIGVITYNHWQDEAKPVILDVLNKAKAKDSFDERWYSALGSMQDQSGVKAAVMHILPFAQNAAGFVVQNHWEEEARPVVIAALAAAKPNDNFNNSYIAIAAAVPQSPGFKEALLNILPRNQDAIDFVVQNHWEADAKPILLRKMASTVLGQEMPSKWVKALASARDPATYPLLMAYTGKKLKTTKEWFYVENIRPLPANLVTELVGGEWASIQGTDAEQNALSPVATWGFPGALDRAAAILSTSQETDKQKSAALERLKLPARAAIANLTPAPDGLLDPDLAAWWTANKATLGFDPGLNRFVLHPRPLSPEQSWPSAEETMKALGQRVEDGDAAAFDEIKNTLDRATEGIDPKRGADKIKRIRDALTGFAFNVLKNDVPKNPGILAKLEPANRFTDLTSFVVDIYGRAAQEGNQDALQALLHYQTRQWSITDAIRGLGGAVAKGDPLAIAFLGNLPADPNCTPQILDRAAYLLLGPANAGNGSAQTAYRAVRKARP